MTAGRSVNIVNGGLVSADSLGGTGLAGNIKIVAGDQIAMDQGSVSTRAVTSDGGNIAVTVEASGNDVRIRVRDNCSLNWPMRTARKEGWAWV